MKKTKVVMPLISMLVSLAAIGCNESVSEPISSSSSSTEILFIRLMANIKAMTRIIGRDVPQMMTMSI